LPILLDTTVLVDALRGRSAAGRLRSLHLSRQVPWICAVNVEEVMRGIREHERDPTVRLLRGMHWRRDFAARGVTLSQADCLIAAAAVGVGIPLATGNPKDFPMPELEVEHWPVGA
jgi:predicted nucleic acid-binding protein